MLTCELSHFAQSTQQTSWISIYYAAYTLLISRVLKLHKLTIYIGQIWPQIWKISYLLRMRARYLYENLYKMELI